jgi:hypothetical protein
MRAQGSPTVANPRPETFRHALAVTTVRPGSDGTPYLYTLNMSCPQVCVRVCVCVCACVHVCVCVRA